MQVKPYVYKLTHPETGEFYIGSRAANKEPWHTDLPKYRTSSKYVKPRFDEFKQELLMEFSRSECAVDYEQYLIHQELGNPLMLNRACTHQYKLRFSTAGSTASEETRGKQRLVKLGKKQTPEAIQKALEGRRGKLKGRKLSEEMKERIRQKLTGFKQSEETRRKLSEMRTGKKLNYSSKGLPKPEGHAENVRAANIGMRCFNNGEITVRTRECPEGFVPGMLRKSKRLLREQ